MSHPDTTGTLLRLVLPPACHSKRIRSATFARDGAVLEATGDSSPKLRIRGFLRAGDLVESMGIHEWNPWVSSYHTIEEVVPLPATPLCRRPTLRRPPRPGSCGSSLTLLSLYCLTSGRGSRGRPLFKSPPPSEGAKRTRNRLEKYSGISLLILRIPPASPTPGIRGNPYLESAVPKLCLQLCVKVSEI